MEEKKTDFSEVVYKIKNNSILLPDFQRKFVWTDEEKQRKLIASVLAKMPIGSVLLLKSSSDEFASKMIGNNNEVKIEEEKKNCSIEYLLDGQQRITVLSNVFSDVIFENCRVVKDLVSNSLLRRFFLKIPRYQTVVERKCKDHFGVERLKFPYSNPEKDEPTFLTQDILESIISIDFKKTEEKPYNPFMQNTNAKIASFCMDADDEYYLLPLYLLVESTEASTSKQRVLNYIINQISDDIRFSIMLHYDKQDMGNLPNFLHEIADEDTYNEIKDDIGNRDWVDECMKQQASDLWSTKFIQYLKSCLAHMNLTQIIVEEAKRDRAIDIYENLNLGGISLNTFDLIMARVAKKYKGNFYKRVVNNIKNYHDYDTAFVPEKIHSLFNTFKQKQISFAENMRCCDEKDDDINKTYINVFLNVLSLCSYNPDYNCANIRLEYIKRNCILAIDPEDIDGKCDMVCEGIDRALFFLKCRCGIRTIKDIHYELILALLAYIFTNDQWFNCRGVHDLLEAWYWSAIFSGEFDSDQNSRMITNLQQLINVINSEDHYEYIKNMENSIFEKKNFSNIEFLLMKDSELLGRYPKDVIKNGICQFLIAQTYDDLFDKDCKVSTFMKEANTLEAHHIIPLGSVRKMNENTKQMRDNKGHILNSPFNFIYITKDANGKISDMTITEYKKYIIPTALSEVCFSNTIGSITDDNIEGVLTERCNLLIGKMKNRINSLLENVCIDL